MSWYEELDFDENPFSTNPKEFTDSLIELEEHTEELFYRINSANMLVIEGKKGYGKTSLLVKAIEKFGGRKKIIYVDCSQLDKELDIRDLLIKRYSFIGRFLNKKPKKMILLLDNVNELTKQNNERIKFYFDQNYIQSVIFTCTSYSKVKFSDSIRDRIGKRVIKINPLSPDNAVRLIRERIGDIELFNDKLIKDIYKTSGNNQKKMLENCELAAINAVNKNRNRVQKIDIDQALGDK
ncbi:ATP-binding protein [archaeon]|nr:ATP-binding protein [archaeon]MBT4647627.1 ATP-binding protein [archaeon]MBT6822603.1 ATP-binding protein [archaeon]MBT7392788.1 ATP-binding protein [archaeon]